MRQFNKHTSSLALYLYFVAVIAEMQKGHFIQADILDTPGHML